MARIRRVVVATYRVPIRHVETTTRRKCKSTIQEAAERYVTRAFAEEGIFLTPEDIHERGIRLSTAREWCHGHEVIGYEIDITALV